MREKISLVIPTYNEAKNIEGLVLRILDILDEHNINGEIIVVDDNSPDGTWEIAEGLSQKYSRIKVVRREDERGLATAVVRGWSDASGEILGVIDGDLQHPPEVIPELIKALSYNKDVDIAVASRHVPGGGVSKWNILRRAISWFSALISAFFLPEILAKVRDPMSGYFILRKDVIRGKKLNPSGYKILLEVLTKGSYKEIAEVPYFFKERERGGSKAGLKEYLVSLAYVIRLSIETNEIYRVIKYICVGISGALVTLRAYSFFVVLGADRFVAYGFALELAILTYFILNEVWTFRDKSFSNPKLKDRILRFLQFNLICLYGALFSFLSFIFFMKMIKINAVPSALMGIGVGFLWNFIASSNVVWLSRFSLKKYKIDTEKGYYHRILEHNRIQNYWHKKKFNLLSKEIKDPPVLDIGSGPGVFFYYHGNFSGLKVNLDFSLEQLKYGKVLNPDIGYVNALAFDLPFATGSFGTVFLAETIEHIDEGGGRCVLREVNRVLKKGGRLILTTPNYKSLWLFFEWVISIVGAVDYRVQHINHFNMKKISEYISSAGLTVKKKETFFIFSPFLVIFSLKLSEFIFKAERRLFPALGSLILIEAVK